MWYNISRINNCLEIMIQNLIDKLKVNKRLAIGAVFGVIILIVALITAFYFLKVKKGQEEPEPVIPKEEISDPTKRTEEQKEKIQEELQNLDDERQRLMEMLYGTQSTQITGTPSSGIDNYPGGEEAFIKDKEAQLKDLDTLRNLLMPKTGAEEGGSVPTDQEIQKTREEQLNVLDDLRKQQ